MVPATTDTIDVSDQPGYGPEPTPGPFVGLESVQDDEPDVTPYTMRLPVMLVVLVTGWVVVGRIDNRVAEDSGHDEVVVFAAVAVDAVAPDVRDVARWRNSPPEDHELISIGSVFTTPRDIVVRLPAGPAWQEVLLLKRS